MTLFVSPRQTEPNLNGIIAAGWTYYYYEPGTTTPKSVFSDPELETAAGTSITSDANGRFPAIYLNGAYKVVLKDDEGAEQWTLDKYNDSTAKAIEIALAGGVVSEASVSSLKSVKKSTFTGGESRYVVELGKSAIFRSGDKSAEVALTPQNIIWIPPTGEDGSSGAWEVITSDYPSVELAKTASLPAEYEIATQGYGSPGDYGAARYLVMTSAAYGATPDGILDHAMANGNVLKIQNPVKRPEMGGGKIGDTATGVRSANTAAINAIIALDNAVDVPGLYYCNGAITVASKTNFIVQRGISAIFSNHATDPVIRDTNQGSASVGNGTETTRVKLAGLAVTQETEFSIAVRCRPYQWDFTAAFISAQSGIGLLLEGDGYERENKIKDVYYRNCRHSMYALNGDGEGEPSDNFLEGNVGSAGSYGYTGFVWGNTSNCKQKGNHFYGGRKTTEINPVVSGDTFTLADHGFYTGDPVFFETTGTMPTGLSAEKFYYVYRIDDDTFKVAATGWQAFNGVYVSTSSAGTGTLSMIADGTHEHLFTGPGTLVDDHLPAASAAQGHSKLSLNMGNPSDVTICSSFWGGDGSRPRECMIRAFGFTITTTRNILVTRSAFKGGVNRVPLIISNVGSTNFYKSLIRFASNIYQGDYSIGGYTVTGPPDELMQLAYFNDDAGVSDLGDGAAGLSPYIIWTRTAGTFFYRPVNGDSRRHAPIWLENRGGGPSITVASGKGAVGHTTVAQYERVRIVYDVDSDDYICQLA